MVTPFMASSQAAAHLCCMSAHGGVSDRSWRPDEPWDGLEEAGRGAVAAGQIPADGENSFSMREFLMSSRAWVFSVFFFPQAGAKKAQAVVPSPPEHFTSFRGLQPAV